MDKQGQVSGKGVDENTQEHEAIELLGELMKHGNDNSGIVAALTTNFDPIATVFFHPLNIDNPVLSSAEIVVGVWRILQYFKAVEDSKSTTTILV